MPYTTVYTKTKVLVKIMIFYENFRVGNLCRFETLSEKIKRLQDFLGLWEGGEDKNRRGRGS